MKRNHTETPLYKQLEDITNRKRISFHVPGHKNGTLFPEYAKNFFNAILTIDMTELTGLDDLHAPSGVIAEAEAFAADYFGADHTFFLVGGSTAGNLAMILAVCSYGDTMIVQRNSHKSVINGLELAGARPIFVAPKYDETVDRYTNPNFESMKHAIDTHPDAKGIVLTYPDYFGKTYDIKEMIDYAHAHGIPVLVDEAHGVHFSLGEYFPPSALDIGADMVVQSAHKMAPSMTMGSYLHMRTSFISKRYLHHYLQMIQSSSPSYPLMASLDVARSFLATTSKEDIDGIDNSVKEVRSILSENNLWDVLPLSKQDDPLKITLHMKMGMSGFAVAKTFEEQGIYPELATHNQILLIHGLGVFQEKNYLRNSLKIMKEQLKIISNHATIDVGKLFPNPIEALVMDYRQMDKLPTFRVSLEKAVGKIAAEAVIPYPPGIPFILKGERISAQHVALLTELIRQGARIQIDDIDKGIHIYKGE
ncbi:aminotransferase class I/II-fold pyridoxal phosphate-dependent enzyme [Virgibacillus necropolis]|uniref:Lysine decarboxylase n=1 Tax=Virgibacillus necropolis TaxID=163877 RepID=A0A221M803_9BACI|nr:aminotransferase class I/II-fold pyridoxal phosphate-dependent enzyme [Virgibacillus necropolis]ASN03764.1 lysine decarboxylase [Virgibacillus necropolis]